MYIESKQLFTNAKPESVTGRIIQFPLIRFILALLFLVPIALLSYVSATNIVEPSPEPYYTILKYLQAIVYFFLFMYAYHLFTKYIEKRETFEFSKKGFFKEFSAGFLISMGLVVFMVGLLSILGYYKVEAINSAKIIADQFIHFSMGAFIEELVFRVILFRLVEELLGSWVALVIVSLLFGFAHIGNENATVWTSVAIVISDVLLIGAFIYTKRLWMVWGIHMSWNFFQTGIFGMANSGQSYKSWIKPIVEGPEWITGGSFGIEASYIAIFITLVVGIIVLLMAIKRNQLVQPVWKRIKINEEITTQ
jgi:membrane protease YdiL (CAAX protease family)